MPASARKTSSTTKSKSRTRTAVTKTPTAKGKSKVHNPQPTWKRRAQVSEPEESSHEESHQPCTKHLRQTQKTDFEEVDCNTSSTKEVVEVTSNNRSESNF